MRCALFCVLFFLLQVKTNKSRLTGVCLPLSAVKIHIGGRCYIGKAKKEEWEGPLPDSHTPFKCLCTCIKKMRLMYAIYDG